MKKAGLLFTALIFLMGSYAQEFPFDDLPGIVRQDILAEEEEFQDIHLQDSIIINSEAGYYKGSARTESTDTLIYYKWHHLDQVWIPVHRLIKTYNGDEKVISGLLQHLSPEGEWKNGVLKSYTYQNGLLANVLIQFWHRPDQAWFNHFRKMFNYNDDGSLAEIIHQKWFYEEQDWSNRFRKVFVYHEDGSLASDTVYNSRPSQQEWIYKQLDEYSYNESGFRTEHLTRHFVPDTAIWKNIHRELYNPDASGLVQDIMVQHWCRMMDSWQNVKWIIFAYNDENMVTERLVKNWQQTGSSWIDAHRNLFAYDADNNLDTVLFQCWREGAATWVNKELNDFEYDATGTLISRLTQLWNPWEQEWHNFRLMELVIDLKHLVAGTGDPVMEQKPEVTVTSANPYHPGQPVMVNGISGKIYSVQVSDLTGHPVYGNMVNSGEQFMIDRDLVPGLYVLIVSDGEAVKYSSKILIIR